MIITLLDYILLPIYLLIFYLFTRRLANKLNNPELKKIMIRAFWLRMLGSFIYSMLVQYYYGYGDSFTFYVGGNFFRDQIANDIGAISYLFAPFDQMAEWYSSNSPTYGFTGYFSAPASNMVMRILTGISYLSFNAFLIISLFFGMFSFLGQWKLFMVFDRINSKRNRNLLAWAVLYSPSIWFWGSGILKDSICLGSLGLIIHLLHKIFVRKKFSLTNLLFLCVLIFITNVIKSYIITISIVSISIMFFALFLQSIKTKVVKYTLVVIAFLMFGVLFYVGDFTSQINELAAESIAQIEEFQKNYQTTSESDESSQAGFGIGDISTSPAGLVLKSPFVVFTCLFRPFIWESRKIFILFTSLETMLTLIFTLYIMFKMGIFNFFRKIFNSPYLLCCFVMTILFALIIGFTTFNFGTMIRYKIIFLPFFYFLLVNLYINYVLPKKKLAKAIKVVNSQTETTNIST